MRPEKYRRALFALAAAQMVRLKELEEDVLAIRAKGVAEDGPYLRFHCGSGKWTAYPGKLRGSGIYSAAHHLGLSLKDLADAFLGA